MWRHYMAWRGNLRKISPLGESDLGSLNCALALTWFLPDKCTTMWLLSPSVKQGKGNVSRIVAKRMLEKFWHVQITPVCQRNHVYPNLDINLSKMTNLCLLICHNLVITRCTLTRLYGISTHVIFLHLIWIQTCQNILTLLPCYVVSFDGKRLTLAITTKLMLANVNTDVIKCVLKLYYITCPFLCTSLCKYIK